jgi:hypothetical protein
MSRFTYASRSASCLLAALTILAAIRATPARAFPEYDGTIPNLTAAGGCDGLCHASGGSTSPFYLDFQAAGFVWNATMASADSDGDGFSNGWELQNPSGTWVSGTPDPGDVAFVSNPTQLAALPPLPVSLPASISHTEAAGQNGSENFAVENVGTVPFDYTLTPNDVWMTPDPSSALALPPAEQDVILLNFATGGLAAGLYQSDLGIEIPGIRSDLLPTVSVDLTVPEPGVMLAEALAVASLAMLARPRAGRARIDLRT